MICPSGSALTVSNLATAVTCSIKSRRWHESDELEDRFKGRFDSKIRTLKKALGDLKVTNLKTDLKDDLPILTLHSRAFLYGFYMVLWLIFIFNYVRENILINIKSKSCPRFLSWCVKNGAVSTTAKFKITKLEINYVKRTSPELLLLVHWLLQHSTSQKLYNYTCCLARASPTASTHDIEGLTSVNELYQLIHDLCIALVIGNIMEGTLSRISLCPFHLVSLNTFSSFLISSTLFILLNNLFFGFLWSMMNLK